MPANALRSRSRRRQRRPALWTSIFLSSWMRDSILKMAGSSQRRINLLPQTAHSATICGQTGCEKQFSSWICSEAPTGSSFNTSWSFARPYGIIRPISSVPGSGWTPRFTFLTPVSDSTITCERFTMYLWANRRCISSMTVQLRRRWRRKDMLLMLAFSDRHAEQPVWVLTQKYNSVLKNLCEQARWVCLFHCKDRDSFEDCLRENDVIASRE